MSFLLHDFIDKIKENIVLFNFQTRIFIHEKGKLQIVQSKNGQRLFLTEINIVNIIKGGWDKVCQVCNSRFIFSEKAAQILHFML